MPSQTFTISGPWIAPTGVTSAIVECFGGGGGGGQNFNNAGGGGGGYARSIITVIPGNTYNIVVGAGGGPTTGGGDTTWETNVVVAKAGSPGSIVGGAGGGTGMPNVGTVTFNGGDGWGPTTFGGGGGGGATTTANGINAPGGSPGGGNGGNGGANGGTSAGVQAGGGGGGSSTSDTNNIGSGGNGSAIITWATPGVGGDPHFLGFDGEYFDFHKRGFYTLFQDNIVTVNANLVAMGHQTFISEVGIIFGKHKIKITNKDHIRLPLFGEHKVNLTPEQRKRITSKEFRQLRHFSEGRKYLPGAMSFLSGDITDAYVMPLPHGSVLVSRMLQRNDEFLNITFNIVPSDSTGIVGQTIRKNRLPNEYFGVDSLFEKWNKTKIVP